MKELWRDTADSETLAEEKIVGITLLRREDGRGELLAHHAKGVSEQEQVIFANYIHEHRFVCSGSISISANALDSDWAQLESQTFRRLPDLQPIR